MRLLLDTHIFLWFISGDTKLSASAQAQITDPNNDVYLSVASIWEAVVKNQLGKLRCHSRLKHIYLCNGRIIAFQVWG